MMLKLLNSKSNMPMMVVNDRDAALMNVVEIVLPESSAILCYFLFGKNVRFKCITGRRYALGKKDGTTPWSPSTLKRMELLQVRSLKRLCLPAQIFLHYTMSPFDSADGSATKMQDMVCPCHHYFLLNNIQYGALDIGKKLWKIFTNILELH